MIRIIRYEGQPVEALLPRASAPTRDVTETVRKLKAAQYTAAHPGEVCPAKWKDGEKTLKPSLELVGKI